VGINVVGIIPHATFHGDLLVGVAKDDTGEAGIVNMAQWLK
jgi:hypothetical protein